MKANIWKWQNLQNWDGFNGTVLVILNNLPFTEGHAGFTTEPFEPD